MNDDNEPETVRPVATTWFGVVLDALDGPALAHFYERLLGWTIFHESPEWTTLAPSEDAGYNLAFASEPLHRRPTWPTVEGVPQMQLHLDLEVADVEAAVAWGLALRCRARRVPAAGRRARHARPRRSPVLLLRLEGLTPQTCIPSRRPLISGCGGVRCRPVSPGPRRGGRRAPGSRCRSSAGAVGGRRVAWPCRPLCDPCAAATIRGDRPGSRFRGGGDPSAQGLDHGFPGFGSGFVEGPQLLQRWQQVVVEEVVLVPDLGVDLRALHRRGVHPLT